ncbi:hypothetical protein D3C72_1307380 [compost metagenome]
MSCTRIKIYRTAEAARNIDGITRIGRYRLCVHSATTTPEGIDPEHGTGSVHFGHKAFRVIDTSCHGKCIRPRIQVCHSVCIAYTDEALHFVKGLVSDILIAGATDLFGPAKILGTDGHKA